MNLSIPCGATVGVTTRAVSKAMVQADPLATTVIIACDAPAQGSVTLRKTGFVTNLDSVSAGNQVSRSLRPSYSVLNPPECNRTYSSVWNNKACGTGPARSMLDSPQAWSAQFKTAGQWMRIDAGSALLVWGVRAQARAKPKTSQKVTAFTVQYSTDDSAWRNVDGDARFKDKGGEFDARFATPVMAQYIRITVVSAKGWTSMRAGLIRSPLPLQVAQPPSHPCTLKAHAPCTHFSPAPPPPSAPQCEACDNLSCSAGYYRGGAGCSATVWPAEAEPRGLAVVQAGRGTAHLPPTVPLAAQRARVHWV